MNANHLETKNRRRRDAVKLWAASAVVIGVVTMVLSWEGMQPRVPPQDSAVTSASPSKTKPTNSSEQPNQVALPSAINSISYAAYARRPRYGNKVGTITLPTLQLSWPIFEGTSARQLSRGVGHFSQSVLPGEKDNAVLSGHRTTVFNRLGELHKADQILVKTSAGVFTYSVRSFRIVKRTSRKVIVPTKTAVLTLTTCWPFNHIGATTKAFIVTADLVATAAASN